MTTETTLVYLFSTLLVVSAALLLFAPLVRHVASYGTSRAAFLALMAAMLATGIGAVLLVEAGRSDPVYFVPMVAIAAGLQLASPTLLYLRVRDDLEARRGWGIIQIGLFVGFLGMAGLLAVLLTGLVPLNQSVAFLSGQAVMALGAAALFVRFLLRLRPQDPFGPWFAWLAGLLFGVAFLIVLPYAFPNFAAVYSASGIGGWLIATTVLWRDR